MTLQPPRTPPRRSPGTNEREARDTGRPIGFGGGLFGRTDGQRKILSLLRQRWFLNHPTFCCRGMFGVFYDGAEMPLAGGGVARLSAQGKRQSRHRLDNGKLSTGKKVERRCPLTRSPSVRPASAASAKIAPLMLKHSTMAATE